jgi:hypothetical protein
MLRIQRLVMVVISLVKVSFYNSIGPRMGISPIYENLLSGHRFHFHSPADREIATKIAARVERGVEAQIVPGECEGYPVETGWEGGLYSTAILLLLSPDSVPARVSREDWESALNHFKGNADPPLGAVLVRACPYPKLLERKNFFRWTDDPIETLRAIERWVLSFHPLPERHSFLESLGLDRQGPLPLRHRTAHAPAGEIAQNGLPRTISARNPDHIPKVTGGAPRELLSEGCLTASGLALDRHGRGPPVVLQGPARVIDIEKTPDPEILLREIPLDEQLWRAMAVCSRHGFALELAAEVAGIGLDDARPACDRLLERRLVDPFDCAGPLFRLNTWSQAAAESGAGLEPQRRRHAEVLHARFAGWAQRPER